MSLHYDKLANDAEFLEHVCEADRAEVREQIATRQQQQREFEQRSKLRAFAYDQYQKPI